MANCYNDCIHCFVCQYVNHEEYPSVQQLKDDCRYCVTDAVPKSEAEALEEEIKRLQSILNNYALRYGTVRDQRAVINNAKAEAAKEIFEEIESEILAEIDLNNGVLIEFEGANEPYHRIKGEVSALCKIQDFIAELKKKYSEREGAE